MLKFFLGGSKKNDDLRTLDRPGAGHRARLDRFDRSDYGFGSGYDDSSNDTYHPRVVRLPNSESHAAVTPKPLPPVALDPDDKIKAAVKSVKKEIDKMRRDDADVRERAKELMAQGRTDEVDDLLNEIVESEMYQKQLCRMTTSMNLFRRNARINKTTQLVSKAFAEVVQAYPDEVPTDLDALADDMVAQGELYREGLEKMGRGIRAASDVKGQMSQEKEKRRDQLVSELRAELLRGAPVVAQPPAVIESNPLLAQLN